MGGTAGIYPVVLNFCRSFCYCKPDRDSYVFISMTSYQTDAGRNKTNLIANGSVAIILVISLLIGDSILSIFLHLY